MRLNPLSMVREADVEHVGAGLGGLTLSGLTNDFLFARVIDKFVPTLAQNHPALRKFVDGGSTIGASALWGGFFRHVLRAPDVAEWVQYGGTLLGGSRFATGALSLVGLKYQLSEVTPVDAQVGNIYNPSHPAVQMAAAQQAANPALTPGAASSGSTPSGYATSTYVPIQSSGSLAVGGLY